MSQLSPVTFHGDTVFCVEHQGQPFTPLRPIVENLGLGWASQSQKLNADKTRWGVTIIVTPSEGGEQNTLCLPVRKLPAYLASINPRKVKPQLRAKIELYQRECDDALWDHWSQGKAVRQPQAPTLSTAASRAPLRSLVHAWAQVSHQPHAALWAQVKAHFQLSRIDDLPEDWLADALAFVQSKIDAASNPQALPGNSSEIPNSSPMPPTPQQLDVEIPSMALVPPPATPEEYAQRAKVFLADLAKLRAHTFAVFSRASFALAAPYNHRCKGDTLPAHKHPFADAMNYSIQDLSMAAVKNISSMELLITAYVEGQKIVNA